MVRRGQGTHNHSTLGMHVGDRTINLALGALWFSKGHFYHFSILHWHFWPWHTSCIPHVHFSLWLLFFYFCHTKCLRCWQAQPDCSLTTYTAYFSSVNLSLREMKTEVSMILVSCLRPVAYIGLAPSDCLQRTDGTWGHSNAAYYD